MQRKDYLMHYGILRKSGRYPWGSGSDPAQRSKSFIDHLADMRSQGMADKDIAAGWGMTTTQLRDANTIARAEKKASDISQAQRLKDKGWSNVEIGKRMGGINESSVRSLLAEGAQEKLDILKTTTDMLRRQVDEKGYIDIGGGVENNIGVSKEKLATAVSILREEGYAQHNVQVNQLGTAAGNKTIIKVLAPPGTEYRDIAANTDKIRQITEHSDDSGRSFIGLMPPISVNSKRLAVRYEEDGGAEADGVIYVRPGAKDLSLGGSRYAQVRIAVDGTHYIKGMAMYKDDLPAGTDLVFNTAKSKAKLGPDKLDALKPMKTKDDGTVDMGNPFSSMVRQIGDRDGAGRLTKVTSAMNIVNEQGDWEGWKKSLSSQVLSKQSPKLAKTQLDKTYDTRKKDLDEIMSLTNPSVRKKLLDDFADNADAAAVHLKAAALDRQAAHVILPINSMKPSEIYAPNYRNGERVALIRFPHGGIFEIPELTVNNSHGEAKKLIGDAPDAVGIHHEVAKRLSGADFDGDTVLVIPNPGGNILKTAPSLAGLKDFDPQREYPGYEGMKKMTAEQKGSEMGKVSNLITDMTIKGAPMTEIARAVRHSMVVIDAEKHGLNWKESAKVNGIAQLKTKYQNGPTAGASTLISRATARADVRAVKERSAAKGGPIDKATGRRMYEPKGEPYEKTVVNKRTGVVTKKTVTPMMRSKQLVETDDARTLVSKGGGTKIEHVYAEHSNRLKALANTARKESVNTTTIPYSRSANVAYKEQVKTLDAKLNTALQNRPRERQAQVVANANIALKKQENPNMERAEIKKLEYKALEEARVRVGAKKEPIDITDLEWEAIQAGAITNHKLSQILNNTKIERVKELATPRAKPAVSGGQVARAKALRAAGRTQAEIAEILGVSLSTLKAQLKEADE